jgi:hypothetical protein
MTYREKQVKVLKVSLPVCYSPVSLSLLCSV